MTSGSPPAGETASATARPTTSASESTPASASSFGQATVHFIRELPAGMDSAGRFEIAATGGTTSVDQITAPGGESSFTVAPSGARAHVRITEAVSDGVSVADAYCFTWYDDIGWYYQGREFGDLVGTTLTFEAAADGSYGCVFFDAPTEGISTDVHVYATVNRAPAAGWHFTVDVTGGVAAPRSATADAGGIVSFAVVQPARQTAHVQVRAQLPAGFHVVASAEEPRCGARIIYGGDGESYEFGEVKGSALSFEVDGWPDATYEDGIDCGIGYGSNAAPSSATTVPLTSSPPTARPSVTLPPTDAQARHGHEGLPAAVIAAAAVLFTLSANLIAMSRRR